jgi:uncharacterized surface protein with fasciclin (FAS1) repeats
MNRTKTAPPTRNLVETLVDAGSFTSLALGLEAAGLLEKLAGKGPFTLFAPSDEAFGKLPQGALEGLLRDREKLRSVIAYHVTGGHRVAGDLKSGDVKTVQGSPVRLRVSKSKVQVNGARVTTADMVATNGVIHVIDEVLLPENVRLADAA